MKKPILFLFTLIITSAIFAQGWEVLEFTTVDNNNAVSFINNDTGFIAGGEWEGPIIDANDSYVYKTEDGGDNWSSVFFDSNTTPFNQIFYFNDTVAVGKRWEDNIIKTIDGGETWTNFSFGIGGAGDAWRIQALDSLNYFLFQENILYYTADGGINWEIIETNIPQLSTSYQRNYEFINPDTGFFWQQTSAYAKLITTKDGGKTFNNSLTVTTDLNTRSKINIGVIDATSIIASISNKIVLTNDLGEIWDTVMTIPNNISIRDIDVKENYVLAVGEDGTILKSTDYGQSFSIESVPTNLRINSVDIVSAENQIAYAVCDDGIILRHRPITVAVSDEISNSIEIYPNPSLGIFTISVDKNAQIIISNSLGQQVFESEILEHRVLNIDNLSKGVYFINFKFNDSSLVKRILIE